MTTRNFNLTPKELEDERAYKAILSNTTYKINQVQFEELNRLASCYESLSLLLPSTPHDPIVLSISHLLNDLNSSTFGLLETIRPTN